MTRKKVREFVGKPVILTFKEDVFNEATQSWILSSKSYGGILVEYDDPRTKMVLFTFQRGSNFPFTTAEFAWCANRIKSIKEVLL